MTAAHLDPASPARPSPWKALVRVITEPAATFEAFSGRIPIFPGYLIQMLFSLGGTLMLLPASLALVERTLVNTPNYTPQLLQTSRISAIIGGIAAALIVPWVAGLVVALLATFFGQFQEERVPFTSYLGMVGYARMPVAFASLLAGILGLALGEKALSVSISLAALLPAGSNAMLRTVLNSVNPFDIWYYCVLAIGFGKLHRAPAKKGLGLVVALYVITLLFSLAGAAISSKFAPQM